MKQRRLDGSGGVLARGFVTGLLGTGMLGRLPFTQDSGEQQKSNEAKSSQGDECNHEDRH